ETPELLLALPHLALGPESTQLRGGALGEDLEEGERALLERHRPRVEDREVAEDRAVRAFERNAEVADGAALPLAVRVGGEGPEPPVGDVDEPLLRDDLLAGRAVDRRLPVDERPLRPEGEGAQPA